MPILDLNESDILALDLETYVLPEYKHLGVKAVDPYTSAISLASISTRSNTYVLDLIICPKLKEFVYEILKDKEKLLVFNGSFEYKFIKKHIGLQLDNLFDIRTAAQLIGNATGNRFRNSVSGNSLSEVLRDYLGIELSGKDTLRIEDWYPRPKDVSDTIWLKKVEYAAKDTMYLFELFDIMYPVLTNSKAAYNNIKDYGLGYDDLLELEMSYISVVGDMELQGIPLDEDLYKEYHLALKDDSSYTGKLYEIGGELALLLNLPWEPCLSTGKPIPTKSTFNTLNSSKKLVALINKSTGLSLDKTERALLERLLELLEQLDSTGKMELVNEEEKIFSPLSNLNIDTDEVESELKEIESSLITEKSQIISKILEYKKYYKQHSINLMNYRNPVSGCIHSRFDSNRAATGRQGSSNPNAQNISDKVHVDIPVSIYKFN